MARIVCVHGIAQQVRGEQTLLQAWRPAIADGVVRAGGVPVSAGDVTMAFYGDLFRPSGELLSVGDPYYRADDVRPGFEQELLLAWWRQAAAVDAGVPPPDADTLIRAPRSVQTALRALSRSRCFARVAERSLVFDLKQVSGYLLDPQLRQAARARVAAAVTPETRVMVAHSLGSVVAYEALCSMPDHSVRAFITLGSPLGIANLIFDRLDPAPRAGRGVWPGPDALVWTNIVDHGDVVALEKDLRPRFGDGIRNAVVHNGAHAHDVSAYLTDALTGQAIRGGLDVR